MLLLLQVAQRVFTPRAVHDTVRTVVRDPAFRRSLQRSWGERLLLWLNEMLHKLDKFLQHLPPGRTIGIVIVALIVLFIMVRLAMGIYAARDEETERRQRARSSTTDDPWNAADSLAARGQFEEAAHHLYRGVIQSISRDARIRLDPSKTSGDYARELRRRNSSSLAPFRAFTRRFEFAVYGHGPCDRAAYEELRALSEPFLVRARAA